MTRKEYMDLLSRALENVEPEVARDIMEDYEAHFERAKESGRSDEEVIEELGSIEEFREELDAFINKEKSTEKKRAEDGKTAREDSPEAKGAPNASQEEEEKRRQQERAAQELERARSEMNRAFEEMQRAREELERATEEIARETKQAEKEARENERAAEETAREMEDAAEEAAREVEDAMEEIAKETEDVVESAAREASRAAREAEREAKRAAQEAERNANRAGSQNNMDIDNLVNSAKNIASTVLNQVSGAMDKAFSGFDKAFTGLWMGNFEKSGEDMRDYRRRQENAKSEAAGYQREHGMDGKKAGKDGQNDQTFYYSFDYDNDSSGESEQYMPEYHGFVTQEEGIRHLVVDSKSAEVDIRPSQDNRLFFHYINDGSANSKIIYYFEKRVSQNTLTLSIMHNEKMSRKNHSSILGGVFEGNPDLRIELHLPSWLGALEVNGKSGDIEMEGVDIATLMLKSMSGDISVRGVNADKCMAETMSGDVNVKDGAFGSVLASSKSGDANAQKVKAERAAFKSMSGDATAQDACFGEAVVSSMSGDARVSHVSGRVISVSSMSGDAAARGLTASDAKISAVSGDVDVQNVNSDNLLMTVSSGDMQGVDLSVKTLKASSASGDMSMRGRADQMNLTNGSGDVIVVLDGNTKAAVSTRSGEVHFHLKNKGAGFASKVATHGETNYRYGDLHLRDVANGIHRYGAEGSSLEIKSTSGDITITD